MTTTTTSTPTTPNSWTIFVWVTAPPDGPVERKPAWLPRFAEIAQSLRGSNTLQITINFPWERMSTPGLLVGATTTTMMSTTVAWCHNGHHLHRLYDNFYQSSQLGPSFHGGWLPYGYSRRCHRCGILKAVVATSTWLYLPWLSFLCKNVFWKQC